jgi:hypothetical protein
VDAIFEQAAQNQAQSEQDSQNLKRRATTRKKRKPLTSQKLALKVVASRLLTKTR